MVEATTSISAVSLYSMQTFVITMLISMNRSCYTVSLRNPSQEQMAWHTLQQANETTVVNYKYDHSQLSYLFTSSRCS